MSKSNGNKSSTSIPGRRMSHDKFILSAITNLRTGDHKGIHVVFSGFNQAFRDYYGEDARPYVDSLKERGIIAVRPARGGAMIAKAEDVPVPQQPNKVLAKIIGR